MRLSEHFTLGEFTKSETAESKDIPNEPGWIEICNLGVLCDSILEPIRSHYGTPFSPLSGYRSLILNNEIGSSPSSQHVTGQAADIEVPGVSNYDLAVWIRDNLKFDQLILENHDMGFPSSGWVHVSFVGINRGEVLEFRNGSWTTGLPE